MKIHMEIAKGYRYDIARIKLLNPSWDDKQVAAQFVADKYGTWIKSNLGDDFTICDDVTENDFRIDFTYEDDASAFVRILGGSRLED